MVIGCTEEQNPGGQTALSYAHAKERGQRGKAQ